MMNFSLIALQIFAPVLTAMVTVATGVIAKKASDMLGLQNEKLLRDALHQAAENGLAYALSRGAGPMNSAVIKEAVDYVKSKNPDTLRRLRVSDNALVDIIRTKFKRPASTAGQ